MAFAARHSGRITAAVRSKSAAYQDKGAREFRKFPQFAAIAEVLMYHARKTNKKGHVIQAHTTPITIAESHEPWTKMFDGDSLAPPWKDLMARHPDRFVLGFDNVWARHWEEFYLPQVKLWRKVLSELPDAAAHAVAHGNAERLWNLH